MRRLLLTATAALALLASPASAATPFTVGTGVEPEVAVSDSGVGHVVWTTSEESDKVGYCRVPRAGAACDRTEILAWPGGGTHQGGQALVYAIGAGKVVIVAGCWNCGAGGTQDRVFQWVSNDAGGSFGPATEIGGPSSFSFGDASGAWLDDVGLFVGVDSRVLRAMPPGADSTVTYSGFGTNYGPEVARLPGTTRLVAAVNDLETVRYSVYNGAPLTADNINTQTNWNGPLDLPSPEGDNDESGLNSGPAGLFLHYKYFVANNSRLGLRRLDPTTFTFGGPQYIEGSSRIDDNSLDYPDTTQDGAGRVHAVWRSLYDEGRLRYTVSDPAAEEFTTAANLATREVFIRPRVGAAPDGSGFAAWTAIGAGPIRVVSLDPQPEPGVREPETVKRVSVPGASISFGVPEACLTPGRTFRATLKWKRKKRKGNLFVKVRRADFYIGTKRVKIDKRAPFVQTLTVNTAAARGSTITLRARAFIKVKRGKSPTKSIRSSIRVCP